LIANPSTGFVRAAIRATADVASLLINRRRIGIIGGVIGRDRGFTFR